MVVVLLLARDPLQAGDGSAPLDVATSVRAEGHDVVLVLLEEAVAVARPGHRHAPELAAAVAAGVGVVAEEEALARRAVHVLADGVKAGGFAEVVDLLMVRSDRQAWL